MKLYTTGFPHCCTAKIVYGFGETRTADTNTRAETTEAELHTQLEAKEQYYKRAGDATLIVTLNSAQKTGDKVLRARGYKYSKWMSKGGHPEVKLRVYYKALN